MFGCDPLKIFYGGWNELFGGQGRYKILLKQNTINTSSYHPHLSGKYTFIQYELNFD